jgi:SAM-dependent methyltransferase
MRGLWDRAAIGGRLSKSHWADYHRRWSRLGPPLRPNHEVVECLRDAVHDRRERVLLLGITPELADIGADLVGVDHSETMIANIWPGNTDRRRAVKGEWLALDFAPNYFSAVVGDGALNTLPYPGCHRSLYDQLLKVLRPGGRLAMRVFMAPPKAEPIAAVCEQAMKGAIRSFHAFKWRLAMAIVAEAGDPNIPVVRIRDVFDASLPDRARLARGAGWCAEDIDTIDVYRGSAEVYSFPTFEELRAAVPDSFTGLRLIPAGSYELAERCPVVAMDVTG